MLEIIEKKEEEEEEVEDEEEGREGRGIGLIRMYKNKDWIACFFLGQGKPVVSAAE